MAPRLHFGPADHDRWITPEEAELGTFAGCYRYEIIDGRLYVSPFPGPAAALVESWLWQLLREYWIIDTRPSYEQPTLLVFRRQGGRWRQLPDVPGGGTYTTPLLPGFTLTLNTRD